MGRTKRGSKTNDVDETRKVHPYRGKLVRNPEMTWDDLLDTPILNFGDQWFPRIILKILSNKRTKNFAQARFWVSLS